MDSNIHSMRIITAYCWRIFGLLLVMTLITVPAFGHPPSAIVVDRQGQVYFVDVGVGVWKVDLQGHMVRHPGPHHHFMTIDDQGSFVQQRLPRRIRGDVSVIGTHPTLIFSGEFPVEVGSDAALYYPQVASDGHVQVIRLAPSGKSEVFAILPVATEIGTDGKAVQAQWIHGLAAGPDGSLYYTEKHAVRRIAKDGTVSLVAGNVTVPDCVHPSGANDKRLGPALRDLEVGTDGTIYVAASACSAVLKITQQGAVSVVLHGSDDWSPMGVALSNGDLYVLEYRYIDTRKSEDWLPRVRKISSNGEVSVIASVDKR